MVCTRKALMCMATSVCTRKRQQWVMLTHFMWSQVTWLQQELSEALQQLAESSQRASTLAEAVQQLEDVQADAQRKLKQSKHRWASGHTPPASTRIPGAGTCRTYHGSNSAGRECLVQSAATWSASVTGSTFIVAALTASVAC